MTVMPESARRQRVQEALDAHSETDGERRRLRFRGEEILLPVVRLPLVAVVLNPNSHRIKAQLESDDRRERVEEEPYGEDAQALISELLEATEGFGELRDNLREEGQLEEGVATRAGVLVNANTRVAALRQINPHGFVRVALLPSDAGQSDIAKLELELQVRKDFKQDYTFTNELLFIDELKTSFDYRDEEAARALSWAASSDEKQLKAGIKRVQQSTRMLSTIRELQVRSDHTLKLTFFDDKRQALLELDDEYEQLKLKNSSEAQGLREARMLGILAGAGYRDLRQIKPDTIEDYLLPTLKSNEQVGVVVETLLGGEKAKADAPGLDELFTDADDSDQGGSPSNIASMVDAVARGIGSGKIHCDHPSGKRIEVSSEKFVDALQESIEESADTVRLDTKTAESLQGPAKHLEAARRSVRQALATYKRAAGRASFDAGRFTYQLKHLVRDVDALRVETDHHLDPS